MSLMSSYSEGFVILEAGILFRWSCICLLQEHVEENVRFSSEGRIEAEELRIPNRKYIT